MKKEYLLSVDILRVLSILSVILIHTTITILQVAKYDLNSYIFTFFLNQIAIFAVPMFFLISGFVLELHHKQLSYVTFFKKRASRIVIPYLFWSLYYFFMYPGAHAKDVSFLYLFLSGKASYQLYFIPTIIMFYSIFPLLHAGMKWLSKPYIIGALICIQLGILGRSYYIEDFSIEPSLRALIHCFAFFISGMVASHYQKEILSFVKTYKMFLYVGLLSCITIGFAESYWLYMTTKKTHSFYSQFHLIVLPYTFLLAGLVFSAFSRYQKGKELILTASKLSFFVFFIHVSIMFVVWDTFGKSLFFLTRDVFLGKPFFDIFFFACVTALSFLIAALVHKVPYLSKITG